MEDENGRETHEFGCLFILYCSVQVHVLDFLPLDSDEKKKYQNNVKAGNSIIAALSENELIKLMQCKLVKEFWDKIENIYEVIRN